MNTIRVLVVLALLARLPLAAQTRFDAGLAIGQQGYADASESPRILTSAELQFLRRSFGVQVAVEYGDLPEGALIVVHPNVVLRHEFAGPWFGLVGGGPTFATIGSDGNRTTWNALGEFGYRTARMDIFARVRQYDYELQRFRAGEAGPDGPAVYLGVRFRIR